MIFWVSLYPLGPAGSVKIVTHNNILVEVVLLFHHLSSDLYKLGLVGKLWSSAISRQ